MPMPDMPAPMIATRGVRSACDPFLGWGVVISMAPTVGSASRQVTRHTVNRIGRANQRRRVVRERELSA